MSTLIKVADRNELKPGESKVVTVEGRELAVFNVSGQFHVIDNLCPHRGGPLGEGVVEGALVTCPWHGWRFDVTTGKSPVVPTAKVDVIETVVENNEVKVRL